MEPISFRMGSWKVNLHASTPDVEKAARHFAKFICAFLEDEDANDLTDVIIASPTIFEKSISSIWLKNDAQGRWEEFFVKLRNAYRLYCKAQSLVLVEKPHPRDLFCFSWPEPGFTNLNQPKSASKPEDNKQIIALITHSSKDITYLSIWGYLFFLATQWHVVRGGLSLHSSAVSRGSDGFLFFGHSEAGKSTVAKLSAAIGLSALGDDLNFVTCDFKNGYRLTAAPSPKIPQAGYSLKNPRLRGIFTLVQDKSDYLIPISPIKLAPVLFDSFIKQTPYVHRISDNLVVKAFQTICDLAQQVPGYELHFRKSPDFWKIIDEQFPE